MIVRNADGADLLAWQLKAAGLVSFVREYRFHVERRWRLDLAFVEQCLGIEVNGGLYTAGRHSRAAGQEADYEKFAELAIVGWRLIVVSTGQAWTERALSARADKA